LFTAFLAGRAAHVTAVESYPLAVHDARYNLAEFGNVRLVEGTVEAFLSDSDEAYDDAVLDPPRAGVDAKALAALVGRAPARLCTFRAIQTSPRCSQAEGR
jgi:tRNA/tmRNA/rRNA uracil-C5-methylase (TrmA/RlmC/RlmD family)